MEEAIMQRFGVIHQQSKEHTVYPMPAGRASGWFAFDLFFLVGIVLLVILQYKILRELRKK